MAFDNLRQFNRDLRRAAERATDEQVVLIQKKITLDLLAKIVLRTPVDTGRARANWQVTIDVPAETAIGHDDKGGTATIAAGAAALASLRPYATTWISNNVPYIVPLEEGHSKQAPPGTMVALSIEEIRQELAGGVA